MRKLFLAASAAALSLGIVAPACADTGVVSFTGGTLFPGYTNDETVGFKFNTANAINVTDLGWYAATGTLLASHQVGIWNASGTLLGSTTITAGAAGSSGFRFASVSPFQLAAGDYYIGGRDTLADGDSYLTSVTNLTMGNGITFLGSAVSQDDAGFAFPDRINATTTGGRFGGNFLFSTAGAVPEPATWAMMLVGFGGIGFAMRRRKNVTTRIRFA